MDWDSSVKNAMQSEGKVKQGELDKILDSAFAKGQAEGVIAITKSVLVDEVPLTLSRPILQKVALGLSRLELGERRKAAEETLELLRSRGVSFIDQTWKVRLALADVLESEENWKEAAQVLGGIDLEGAARLEEHFKLKTSVRIGQLFLEADDPVSAEQYTKMAAPLVSGGAKVPAGKSLSEICVFPSLFPCVK